MLMHGRTVPQTADDWAEEHGHRLDSMTRGRSARIEYCGTVSDATDRTGSDVYTTGDEYTMSIVGTRLSDVPGAPTTPGWQWYRSHPDGRAATAGSDPLDAP